VQVPLTWAASPNYIKQEGFEGNLSQNKPSVEIGEQGSDPSLSAIFYKEVTLGTEILPSP